MSTLTAKDLFTSDNKVVISSAHLKSLCGKEVFTMCPHPGINYVSDQYTILCSCPMQDLELRQLPGGKLQVVKRFSGSVRALTPDNLSTYRGIDGDLLEAIGRSWVDTSSSAQGHYGQDSHFFLPDSLLWELMKALGEKDPRTVLPKSLLRKSQGPRGDKD